MLVFGGVDKYDQNSHPQGFEQLARESMMLYEIGLSPKFRWFSGEPAVKLQNYPPWN